MSHDDSLNTTQFPSVNSLNLFSERQDSNNNYEATLQRRL